MCAKITQPNSKFQVFPIYLCSANITDEARSNKESSFIGKYKSRRKIVYTIHTEMTFTNKIHSATYHEEATQLTT